MSAWRRLAAAWALSVAVLLGLASRPASAQAVEGTPDDLPDVAFDEGGCARGEPGGPSWAVNLATLQLSVEALDFRARALGPEVRLRRVHSASQARPGLFGTAWSTDYEARVTRSQTGARLDLAGGYSVSFTGQLWMDGNWRTTDLTLATVGTSLHRLTYLTAGLPQPAFVLDDPRTRWLWRFEQVSGSEFRLMSVADRHGNALTLTHDAGVLSRITDAVGRVVQFGHDGSGRVITITAPDTRRAFFSYDALGRLTESVDFLGRRTAYTYDPSEPRITSINASGRLTTFEWTFAGPPRVSAVIDPALARTTYALDTVAGRTTITSPLGFRREVDHQQGLRTRETDGWWRVVRTEYTGGRPSRVIVENGSESAETRFEYDADGNLARRIDPLGRVTSYGWSAQRTLLSVTDATGARWGYEYDDRLSLREIVSPLLVRTRFDYDSRGRLQRVLDGLSRFRSLTWDVFGNLESVTDRAGRVLTFTHDLYGRLQTMLARTNGSPMALGYDALDRRASVTWAGGERRVAYEACDVVTSTDENGRQTAYAWDARRRTMGVTDAAGGRVQFERDLDGLVTAIRDPLGRISRATIDRNARSIQLVDPANQPWQARYDPRGRLASLTDPRSAMPSLSWNRAGELTGSQDALNRVEGYGRDALGRVETLTTAANRIAEFSYDPDGRRAQVTHDSAIVHRSTYDLLGQLLERDDAAAQVIGYTYDPEGRVASATWRGSSLQAAFTWDAGGRPGTITYPGGLVVSYAYDARERVRSVTIGAAQSTFAYDVADHLVSIARPQGVTSAFQWDAAGRMVAVEHRTSPAVAFVSLSITRDAAGNVVAVTGTEPMPRSAQVTLPATSYNAAGQIASRGTDAYTYSAAGDLVSVAGGTWTADYDPQHRLRTLTRAGQAVAFAWDADGRRIARTAGGIRRDFHYGPDGTLLFESENGGLRRSYVYVDGRLFAMVEAGAVRYFHFDHLGSTLALTDAAGVVVGGWGYTPTGLVTAKAGSPPLLFTFGGEFGVQDEGGGLFVMGARVYDATTLWFLQRHPGGLAAGPLSYEYAGGNPTSLVAPTGLSGRFPTGGPRAGGGRITIDEVLRAYDTYSQFRPGVDLANDAQRTHDTIPRKVGVHEYWTRPGRPTEAPAHDFWGLWGVLR